jgi:NADH-quinone oxidoreductase subunit L
LIGTPFFSGFYSKDSIIEAVHIAAENGMSGAGFAYFAVLAGVFITAFYSFRMFFLVFHGQERMDQLPHDEHHHHHDDHHAGTPHESPWVVTAPLIFLAIPSVFIGLFAIEPMLFGNFFDGAIQINSQLHPALHEMRREFHGVVAMVHHGLTTAPFWLAFSGVLLSGYFYLKRPDIPARLQTLFKTSGLYQLAEQKYYMDHLYIQGFARLGRQIGYVFWRVGDVFLIDGLLVNGSARTFGVLSAIFRKVQTGYIYHYAMAMIVGVLLALSWLYYQGLMA